MSSREEDMGGDGEWSHHPEHVRVQPSFRNISASRMSMCAWAVVVLVVLLLVVGGIKAGSIQLPWQRGSLKFFAPFLQLDITTRSARFSPHFRPTLSPSLTPLPLTLSLPLQHQNFLFEGLSRFQVQPNAISGPVQHWVCGFIQCCVLNLCVTQEKYDWVCSCMEDACGKPEVIGILGLCCLCAVCAVMQTHHNKPKQTAWLKSRLLARADNEMCWNMCAFVCASVCYP